jgi:hypothetical protein
VTPRAAGGVRRGVDVGDGQRGFPQRGLGDHMPARAEYTADLVACVLKVRRDVTERAVHLRPPSATLGLASPADPAKILAVDAATQLAKA